MGDHTVDAHSGCGGTKVVYVEVLRSILWTLRFLFSNPCLFTDRSKAVLLLWTKHVLLCFHARLFVDALWPLAGKGLTSWLSFVMFNRGVVSFPLVSRQVWCLIVSIPVLCPLSYFGFPSWRLDQCGGPRKVI